jgi:amino acid transporter
MIGEKLQRIASNKIDGKTALLNKKTPDMQPRKFGTFGGVFTPSLLTILGVITFLRFSIVVGYAGLWNALLILLVAKTISLITGLSIASIATNMRVKGGGAYYLISRSLGVEFGGVIAVFFYIIVDPSFKTVV